MAHDEERESTLRKPNCFGRAAEYDPRDPTCKRCRWETTCSAIVTNSRSRADDRRDDRRDDRWDGRRDDRRDAELRKTGPLRPGQSFTARPDPEDFVEREDSNMGFFGALMFNATLSGGRALLVETIFSLDQIPREPYRDPFRELFTPKRSPARQRDEDR